MFDVGPHNGYFTLKAAQLVGPEGLVVAVEASPINYHLVKKQIACNGLSNVRLVLAAAYSVDGETLTLYSQSGADMRNVTTVGNTVVQNWTRKHTGTRVRGTKPQNASRTVSTVTLDALARRLELPRVDHIFATVNGAEMDVLYGAEAIIAAHHPEVSMADRFMQRAATPATPTLRAWLEQRGYRFFRDWDVRLGSHGGYDNGTLFASQRAPFEPKEHTRSEAQQGEVRRSLRMLRVPKKDTPRTRFAHATDGPAGPGGHQDRQQRSRY